jgi:hypothetical protein
MEEVDLQPAGPWGCMRTMSVGRVHLHQKPRVLAGGGCDAGVSDANDRAGPWKETVIVHLEEKAIVLTVVKPTTHCRQLPEGLTTWR